MKKKLLSKTTFVLLSAAVAFSGFTLAYLADVSDTKTNAFYPGVLTVSIVENSELTGDRNVIEPDGKSADKQVQVQNINNPHEIDCYIRVMLVPVFRTEQGSLAGDIALNPVTNNITATAPTGQTATLNLASGWQTNWIYDNGHFYHKNIVKPGQLTAVLLDSVSVSDESLWDSFYLEVLSDAVQTDGDAAQTSWGSIAAQLNK